jgi:hypothetical protein
MDTDVIIVGAGPDAYIAWAATADEPAGTVVPALREALFRWFGASLDAPGHGERAPDRCVGGAAGPQPRLGPG